MLRCYETMNLGSEANEGEIGFLLKQGNEKVFKRRFL